VTHPRQRPRLLLTQEERELLEGVKQSGGAPGRIERASMVLAYADGETISAISRHFDVSRPKVQKLIDRVIELGLVEALEDPRNAGRSTTVTPAAQAWLLELASREPQELGYDSPWWTSTLLAQHGRDHGHEHGHTCLKTLSHSTVTRIFKRHGVSFHEIRYARPKGSQGAIPGHKNPTDNKT